MAKLIFSILVLFSFPAYAAKGTAKLSISKSIFDMTYDEAVIYCMDGGNPNCERVLDEFKNGERDIEPIQGEYSEVLREWVIE